MTGFELAVACIALNVYFEADAKDTLRAKQAVALVTVNRMKERNLDACDVVLQPRQFSWANHALDEKGKLLPEFLPDYNTTRWREARSVARSVLSSEVEDFTHGATYFHADYVSPKWALSMRATGKHGRHIFYRVAD